MTTSELSSRNIAVSMRKSVENLVISSQDAIGQSISQALSFSGASLMTQAPPDGQDNKSVSRSPSPSPRPLTNETIVETAEVVKGVDVLAPDARDDPPVLRSDGVKPAASTTSLVPRPEGPKAKKKSWYNALYPTYKSKCDDFKRLFKDLPDDERLIVDYSCALQKDILAHGRLYASQNYLCFYASIFGWETSLTLRWKDVTAITKEKTALVIPNAILVCTEGEKNFLTSFSGRDKAYLMLFRIWQNALMDQQMSSNEMWQWVHSCYGEELGFNSDEEYPRDLVDEGVCVPTGVAEELAETSSLDAAAEPDERRSQRQSAPPVLNGDGSFRSEGGDTLPTDMSDSTDSEPDKPRVNESDTCTSPHEGKLLCSQQFPFNVDNMFTMIFTSSKFNLELLAARGITDYVQASWQPQGGLKCRQISYTLGLTSGPLGPKEVNVTETQVMNKCSKPGVLYSIDSSGENAGIPYADYFTVEAHYCMRRVSENCTHFSVYGHVRYKKSMWPMVKTFLEKNAISGLEDFCKQLEAKLVTEASAAAPARKTRRAYRGTVSSSEAPSLLTAKPLPPTLVSPPTSGSGVPSRLLLALLLMLLVNAALYCKLYYTTPHSQEADIRELHDRLVAGRGGQAAQWASLLEQHAASQRAQLQRWRRAVDQAVQHLQQTELALAKLLETIKPSLERAQKEATEQREEL